MKNTLTHLYREFFDSERTGGYLLIICTVLSLALANSSVGASYTALFKTTVGFDLGSVRLHYPVYHWINDLLMAVFFLLVGLEADPRRWNACRHWIYDVNLHLSAGIQRSADH